MTELTKRWNEEFLQQPGLRTLIRGFKRRIHENKDVALVLTGPPGNGKSTLAVQLAMAMDPHFEFKRNVLFDPTIEDMHAAIYDLPKYSVIVVDEAIRVGNRKNWQSKRNKLLNEMLALCRFKNKVLIFCIPFFSTIDNDLQKRLLFWLHIPRTGYAIFLRQTRNPFTSDPWSLKVNDRLFSKYLQYTGSYSFPQFVKLIRRSPNYLSAFTFNRLPKEIEDEYDANKPTEFNLEAPEVEKPKVSKENAAHLAALKVSVLTLFNGGKPPKEIAELIGVTPHTIRSYLRESGVDLKAAGSARRRKASVEAKLIPEFDLVK